MIKFISCCNFYLLSGGSLLLVAALVTAVLAFRVFWVCFSLNHELFNSSIPKNNPIIPSKQALEIYEWSENCFIIIRRLKLYICIYIYISFKQRFEFCICFLIRDLTISWKFIFWDLFFYIHMLWFFLQVSSFWNSYIGILY